MAALVAQVVGAVQMKTIIVLVLLALLLGPLRRPFFRYGRFTIPAVIGGMLGWILGLGMAAHIGLSYVYSPYLPWIGALMGAIAGIEGFKELSDRMKS